jgi:hypothetical protein
MDHAFEGAFDTVETFTRGLCIDLARILGEAAMIKQMAQLAVPLILLAGTEATSEDPVDFGRDRAAAAGDVRPDPPDAQRSPDKAGGDGGGGGGEDVDALADDLLPETRGVLEAAVGRMLAKRRSDIRSIVDGLGRFTRAVLGVDGIDVIRAWMPPIADEIAALGADGPDVAIDEALAAEVERLTWDYWQKNVG